MGGGSSHGGGNLGMGTGMGLGLSDELYTFGNGQGPIGAGGASGLRRRLDNGSGDPSGDNSGGSSPFPRVTIATLAALNKKNSSRSSLAMVV